MPTALGPPFRTILVANRGEIACRVIRTAKAMGYRTVAVYSDADYRSLAVSLADTSVRIGPPAARESYLDIERIIAAAKSSGADAVHPGYGFLSENAAFAAACVDAGLVFIGPSAAAIDAMGNKAAAKRLMIEAGVPCVPGYQGADQSDAVLIAEARRIGLPVMVKAAAGGGGRGMRLVVRDDDLPSAIASARSEAQNAFASGELILEKAISDARHVEVQVFGDAHGNVLHLGERDCSVQRRHQKVIEEAPSPAVDAALRARIGAAGVQAARSIDYCGAGTVEFLLDRDGQFYFLEMNTRLQVEHPVTEAITGLDLVEWQIRVARGEVLPLAQDEVCLEGHAIEVRLYAEDPSNGYLPQAGSVLAWMPAEGDDIRVDHGLKPQDEVSADYDPMIAKVIAWGETRDEARARSIAALRETTVLGIRTNRSLLLRMLADPVFASGGATTAFIGSHFADGGSRADASFGTRAVAAALLLQRSGEVTGGVLAGWASTGRARYPLLLRAGDRLERWMLSVDGMGRFTASVGQRTVAVQIAGDDGNELRVSVDGVGLNYRAAMANGVLHLDDGIDVWEFQDDLRAARSRVSAEAGLRLLAPMNGKIVRVLARTGETVKAGQCIVVLEAMKMQHEIKAPRDGVLASVPAAEGQQVATRALLAELQG